MNWFLNTGVKTSSYKNYKNKRKTAEGIKEVKPKQEYQKRDIKNNIKKIQKELKTTDDN